MKKLIYLVLVLLLFNVPAQASFTTCYNQGQQYLAQYQYSSAIIEFRKALRINYMDVSARIGLINSYLARGTHYANNEKNWDAAANDFRAALFYLRYYPIDNQDVQNSMQLISNATQNLNNCLKMTNFSTDAQSRYNKGKYLRLDGRFAEAGYEFAQSSASSALKSASFEQLGDILSILGNNKKCIFYYKQAVALNNSNGQLRLKYANALEKSGDNDAALKEYNSSLANGAQDPDITYSLEKIYRQKIEDEPNNASAYTNLGVVLQKQNLYDEALKYYNKAAELEPDNVTTRLNVGTLYQQKKSYDAAIAAYDSILVLYPNHTEANLYKAQCLAAKGEKQQAKEAFANVLKTEANNTAIKMQIFDTLKDTMKPSEIITFMFPSGFPSKDIVDSMYNYALDLHNSKKYDKAISFYNEVIKFDSANQEAYVNLGIAYRENGNLDQAKKVLNDAKNLFPQNKLIQDNLKACEEAELDKIYDAASDLFNKGEFQKAIDIYATISPATFDSNNGIAACYKSLNNDAKAIEYYKKALNLKADSDIAYYIGVLYSETENWDNSKTYLKKAIQINPKNQRAKDLLDSVLEQCNVKLLDDAITLFEKKDYINSLAKLNAILKDDLKNGYAYYYRGQIYDEQKKYALAIADYKKAVVYSQDLSIGYYMIAVDYDTLAQYKNALINYKKYVSLTPVTNEFKTYSNTRIKQLKQYE